MPHRSKPHHSEKIEMSPPGTPALGNDTLTLPLNPNRVARHSPETRVTAKALVRRLN